LLQVRHVNQLEKNNVALPEYFHSIQWRSQPRNLGGAKMFDFRRITLFCLEKRFSKNKLLYFLKIWGDMAPLIPPVYAYDSIPPVAKIHCNALSTVDKFCYFGSVVTSTNSFDAEIYARMGKAATAFGQLRLRVWNNHYLSLGLKTCR